MKPRLLHVTTVPMTLCFVAGHVAHGKSRGFDVHVLSSPGEALDEFARDLQVEAHAVPMARRIAPLSDLAALWGIVRVMRRVRPTIVDAHTPKGGLLAMMAAALCRVPVRVDSNTRWRPSGAQLGRSLRPTSRVSSTNWRVAISITYRS